MSGPIYLDHAATAPLDPRVLEAMLPWLAGPTGNPHNRRHAPGRAAAAAVEEARARVAALVGVRPAEILFTAGTTEANNLAIRGAGRGGIVTQATEHLSVLGPCRRLAAEGVRVTELPVGPDGRVDAAALARALEAGAQLVSIMAANNETGVLQPLDEVAAACRRAGVLLHSDIAQAAGKLPLELGRLGVDLASLGAHKLHGPPGIGALYVRTGVTIEPLMAGGGQERGLRPGTVPVALAVGFGAAAEIAASELAEEARRVAALAERLWSGLAERIPRIRRNGGTPRLPGIVNVAIPDVDGTDLLDALDGLALSGAAACSGGGASHVLAAMGLAPPLAHASLRLSLGRFTTAAEVEAAVGMVAAAARP